MLKAPKATFCATLSARWKRIGRFELIWDRKQCVTDSSQAGGSYRINMNSNPNVGCSLAASGAQRRRSRAGTSERPPCGMALPLMPPGDVSPMSPDNWFLPLLCLLISCNSEDGNQVGFWPKANAAPEKPHSHDRCDTDGPRRSDPVYRQYPEREKRLLLLYQTLEKRAVSWMNGH